MAAADRFPYWIEKHPGGGYLCRFPDFPEFVPEGPSIEILLASLQEGLLPVIEERLRRGAPLPVDRPLRAGEESLALTPTYAVKLQLIEAVRVKKITAVELARRMGCFPQEATSILKFSHPTKIDTLHAAIRAIGGELSCRITFD